MNVYLKYYCSYFCEDSVQLPLFSYSLTNKYWHYLECVDVVQVRKKSARLMQMEESDQLEQQVVERQSRASARRSRGSEPVVREIPAASSLTEENPVSPGFQKPVKVRLSLGAKQDDVDVVSVSPKSRSKRDRRKSAAEVKIERDGDLVVDEPTAAVISTQSRSEQSLVLRMKLNMDPSAGVSSFSQSSDIRQHSVRHSSSTYILLHCLSDSCMSKCDCSTQQN